MAIDEKVFRDSWALLCDRFARQPSSPLMLAYYRTLSPQMTTEQFKAAAQRIFIDREFFPRPADFLESVREDPETAALDQWEQVHDLMRGFGDAAALSPTAARVVRLLGGETKLRNTPVDAIQYVRRDFLKMYHDTVPPGAAAERALPTPEGSRITAELVDRGALRLVRGGNA